MKSIRFNSAHNKKYWTSYPSVGTLFSCVVQSCCLTLMLSAEVLRRIRTGEGPGRPIPVRG